MNRFIKIWKSISLQTKLAFLVTSICLVVSVLLLFAPDIVGVADDGTCTDILNTVNLSSVNHGPADPGYLNIGYAWKKTAESGGWNLQAVLLYVAKYLCYWMTGRRYFDLRYLAALYIILYLPAVFITTKAALSRTERMGSKIVITVITALIFSDAGYIAYFNSLYPEALIYILLLYVAGCAMNLQSGENADIWSLALLAFSGTAFCFIRRYCFLLGMAVGVFCLIQIPMREKRQWKLTAGIAGAVLIGASVTSFAMLPSDFNTVDKLHSMTRGVLFQSDQPEKTLEFFGIDQSYALLTDVSAYDYYPLTDGFSQVLEDGFYDCYTSVDIARYYLMHPGDMLSMMNIAAATNIEIEKENCGSFLESAGKPKGGKNVFWSWYSFLKNRSFPKTIGYFAVLVVACMVLGGNDLSLLKKKNPKKQLFFQVTLFLAVSAVFQTMYIIICCGDTGMAQYNCQFGIVMDILLLFMAAEIVDRLNIFQKGNGQ